MGPGRLAAGWQSDFGRDIGKPSSAADPLRTVRERSSTMRFRACAVYILGNLNRTVLYTGVTNDLLRRVCEHRERIEPTAFTTRYHVDRLVYFEAFDDISAAIEREKQIKSWRRKKKNDLIAHKNPNWEDLWPTLVA